MMAYLTVSQKLVPLLSTELPHTVVLGSQGIVPHQAVGWVLHTGGHHVVGLHVTQAFQGNAEGCSENRSVTTRVVSLQSWTYKQFRFFPHQEPAPS